MAADDRIILHSDCNCFYAAVEMLHNPELRNIPMAVGGDPEARHGIVLTANYIAKRRGVKTGMALWQARQACKDVVFVYLTNETNDKELWKKSIAGIKGFHLMLPNGYWGKLPCIIEFSGIPQYALYDRQGKRVSHWIGFGDGMSKLFKGKILEALGE